MRAMIIDDEEAHVRGMIRHVDWEKYGFGQPMGFTDTAQALQTLKKSPFDLVITDIKMPGMDGLELIRCIHDHGMSPAIIIVSGYDEFPYAQEAIRLGVCGYLLKPLRVEEMEACLESIQDRRLAESVKSRRPGGEDQRESDRKICHPSVKRIIRYVSENYEKDLTIRGLAELSDMNANYLSALFKKETDMNLNAFINETRLCAAHKLLEETDCRISEAAYRSGFSDPGYFSRQFRQFYGYTPSEVRKK